MSIRSILSRQFFHTSNRITTQQFIVHIEENTQESSPLPIVSISKKLISLSSKRNKVKRVIREHLRKNLNKEWLITNILFIRLRKKPNSKTELINDLTQVLQKIEQEFQQINK